MRRPAEFFAFFASRLHRRRLDADMDEEMQLHIALHAETLERQGVSPEEAARRARVEFGGVQYYREAAREARRLSWLHDLVADLHYGARMLRRSPGFFAASVVSLGLGIGANTAIFGLLYGLLMQHLPIPRAEELVAVGVVTKGETYTSMLHRNFLALRTAAGRRRFNRFTRPMPSWSKRAVSVGTPRSN
jgi:hypothetical protein